MQVSCVIAYLLEYIECVWCRVSSIDFNCIDVRGYHEHGVRCRDWTQLYIACICMFRVIVCVVCVTCMCTFGSICVVYGIGVHGFICDTIVCGGDIDYACMCCRYLWWWWVHVCAMCVLLSQLPCLLLLLVGVLLWWLVLVLPRLFLLLMPTHGVHDGCVFWCDE